MCMCACVCVCVCVCGCVRVCECARAPAPPPGPRPATSQPPQAPGRAVARARAAHAPRAAGRDGHAGLRRGPRVCARLPAARHAGAAPAAAPGGGGGSAAAAARWRDHAAEGVRGPAAGARSAGAGAPTLAGARDHTRARHTLADAQRVRTKLHTRARAHARPRRSWASSGCASSACPRRPGRSSTTRPPTHTSPWPAPRATTCRRCGRGGPLPGGGGGAGEGGGRREGGHESAGRARARVRARAARSRRRRAWPSTPNRAAKTRRPNPDRPTPITILITTQIETPTINAQMKTKKTTTILCTTPKPNSPRHEEDGSITPCSAPPQPPTQPTPIAPQNLVS
jgi:hypothetical protein